MCCVFRLGCVARLNQIASYLCCAQELTNDYIEKIDEMVGKKNKELTTV